MDDPAFANIRDCLGPFIGKRLLDVTQHDQSEWEESRAHYCHLMFEGGYTLCFHGNGEIDVEGPDIPEPPPAQEEGAE